ncbi:hypothetical protein V8C42DRAFT_327001 [Trichoderma barbatum]
MPSCKRTSRGFRQPRCTNPRVATWSDLMAPICRTQRLESVASQEMQTLQGPKCWSKSRHLLLLADIRKPPPFHHGRQSKTIGGHRCGKAQVPCSACKSRLREALSLINLRQNTTKRGNEGSLASLDLLKALGS